MVSSNSVDVYLRTYTKDYKGPAYTGSLYNSLIYPQRPIFRASFIPLMMRDPHIWYGVELIKGPIISKSKFMVDCEDEEVRTFIEDQIEKFWLRGVSKALDCIVWGYAGSEVLYEFNKETGTLDYKDLKFLYQRDLTAYSKNGELSEVKIDHSTKEDRGPTFLRPPKIFWTVHNKKCNPYYGRSRLEGAFDTWWEIWQPKGYRGIRHLWYYKYAFNGGILYYQDGATIDPTTNESIPNVKIAQELLDKKETGGSLALPQKTGDNRDWEYEEPKGNAAPEGLLEYGDVLRDELWEGIGVPPEVAKQEESGGFAGRRVPQQAFYSYLQEISNDTIFDFSDQILDFLVKHNFGDVKFQVRPISILQTLQKEEMGLVTGSVDEPMGVIVREEDMQPDPMQQGNPFNQDAQFQSDSDPATGGNQPKNDGKVEDRDSNSFNLSEKAFTKQKKG